MNTGVIGGSGYAGGELLRLLAGHPHCKVSVISAHSNAGESVTSVHPQLGSYGDQKFISFTPEAFEQCELIFLALPHGESAKIVAQLSKNVKIVDLGADFRLVDSARWEKYYEGTHAGTWTYGLADIAFFKKEVSQSQRVANPGCYATAIALGAAPAAKLADLSDCVVVAASGTTGAGRSAKVSLLASEVSGSLTSYKFGGIHQHTPEIEQSLTTVSGQSVAISFTPILAPMPRGILATITAKVLQPLSTQSAHEIYSNYFKDSPFVTVLPPGVMPKTASVLGSNKVQMQVAVDEHTSRLIISVAIDNLGKGAAGQAVQNANIMCGFAETDGLDFDGIGA